MKLIELIEKLQEKANTKFTPDTEVEFIVATKSGEMVCALIEANAKDMAKIFKIFGRN